MAGEDLIESATRDLLERMQGVDFVIAVETAAAIRALPSRRDKVNVFPIRPDNGSVKQGRSSFDGVELETRTGSNEYDGHFEKILRSVASSYECSASVLIHRMYVDDKNCALYEIDIAEDMPLCIVEHFVPWLRHLMRLVGGYNGLVIRHHDREVLSDDPWWPDDFDLVPDNDP